MTWFDPDELRRDTGADMSPHAVAQRTLDKRQYTAAFERTLAKLGLTKEHEDLCDKQATLAKQAAKASDFYARIGYYKSDLDRFIAKGTDHVTDGVTWDGVQKNRAYYEAQVVFQQEGWLDATRAEQALKPIAARLAAIESLVKQEFTS